MTQTKINPEGFISWQSPSNIALVKYWGKHGVQLPINPSISITLKKSYTTTEIKYSRSGELKIDFLFEGKQATAFAERIHKFLSGQMESYPYLDELQFQISSTNTFPHSSGIASSAAAFSALALGIVNIASADSDPGFFREASELSRLGSGSACRSVYGGFVVWGKMKEYPEYSDNFAVPVQAEIHPNFSDMEDAILIVNKGQKKVGSSAGHALMKNHSFAEARIEQANKHMKDLHLVLSNGDMDRFVEIVENEALSLHGLMMSSNPGYILIEDGTIQIINRIREFRQQTKIPLCFTLDAGPNVHLLYPAASKEKVVELIENELLNFCNNRQWIDDGIGQGPVKLI